eukprot:4842812-Pleurochrysis_carterae.AAC.1
MFRGRPRPRLNELDAPSPDLAIIDEWRASLDVCDWRSCGSATRIPVVTVASTSARADSGSC